MWSIESPGAWNDAEVLPAHSFAAAANYGRFTIAQHSGKVEKTFPTAIDHNLKLEWSAHFEFTNYAKAIHDVTQHPETDVSRLAGDRRAGDVSPLIAIRGDF